MMFLCQRPYRDFYKETMNNKDTYKLFFENVIILYNDIYNFNNEDLDVLTDVLGFLSTIVQNNYKEFEKYTVKKKFLDYFIRVYETNKYREFNRSLLSYIGDLNYNKMGSYKAIFDKYKFMNIIFNEFDVKNKIRKYWEFGADFNPIYYLMKRRYSHDPKVKVEQFGDLKDIKKEFEEHGCVDVLYAIKNEIEQSSFKYELLSLFNL